MASEDTSRKRDLLRQIWTCLAISRWSERRRVCPAIADWSERRRELLLWTLVVLMGLFAFLFWLSRAEQRIAVFREQDTFRGNVQEISVLRNSFKEIKDNLQEFHRIWDMLGDVKL